MRKLRSGERCDGSGGALVRARARTYLYDCVCFDEVCPAADDDRGRGVVGHGAPEEVEVGEACCAVCVYHEEPAAACVEHAVAYCGALAAVVGERDDADVDEGRGACEGEGGVGGGVCGAVVDDDEFVGVGSGGEVCEGGSEHGGETEGFIVGGDDDGEGEGRGG
jgi:hypothetical protein